jgi:hypothetical protein
MKKRQHQRMNGEGKRFRMKRRKSQDEKQDRKKKESE